MTAAQLPMTNQCPAANGRAIERVRAVIMSCVAAVCLALVGCVTEPEVTSELRERYEAQWQEINARITNCGVCKGPVVQLKSVPSPRSPAQNKNLYVWNDSICGNLLIGPESPICRNCWHIFIPSKFPDREQWTRVLSSASGFQRPLNHGVAKAPVPNWFKLRSGVVFSQTLRVNRFEESVSFWCDDTEAIRGRLSAHASTNPVSLKIERHESQPGQMRVLITTNN